jgi:hypothetical protein
MGRVEKTKTRARERVRSERQSRACEEKSEEKWAE